jgi:hypothetical protein
MGFQALAMRDRPHRRQAAQGRLSDRDDLLRFTVRRRLA